MKKCMNCNFAADCEDDVCPNCGAVALVEEVAEAPTEAAPGAFCPNCGAALESADSLFCSECGAQIGQTVAQAPVEQAYSEAQAPVTPVVPFTPVGTDVLAEKPVKEKKKFKAGKLGKFLPVIIIVAVIAVLATVTVTVILPALKSPFANLFGGVTKIVTSGDTYEFEGKVSLPQYNEKLKFDGLFMVDYKKQLGGLELSASDEGNMYAYISLEDEIFGFKTTGTYNDDSNYLDYYINDVTKGTYYGLDGYQYDKYDMDEEQKIIFLSAEYICKLLAFMDKPSDVTQDDIVDLVGEYANTMLTELGLDESQIGMSIDEYKTLVAEVVTEFNEIIGEELLKNLSDKDWLEENLGYSKEKGVETFDIKGKTAIKALIDIVESKEDEIQDLVDKTVDELGFGGEFAVDISFWLDEIEEMADEIDVDVKLSYKLKSGYITFMSLDVDFEDEAVLKAEINITKTNKKLSMDAESLQADYDEISAELNEGWKCSQCGNTMSWGEDYPYNNETDENDRKPYCYDCYEDFTTWPCAGCGERFSNDFDSYYSNPVDSSDTGKYCYYCYGEIGTWVCDGCGYGQDRYDSKYSNPKVATDNSNYCEYCYEDILYAWNCVGCGIEGGEYDSQEYYDGAGPYCYNCWYELYYSDYYNYY